MARKLNVFNGRGDHGYNGFDGHFYVCVGSKAEAVRLLIQVGYSSVTIREINMYWAKGVWGTKMNELVPVRARQGERDAGRREAAAGIPAGAAWRREEMSMKKQTRWQRRAKRLMMARRSKPGTGWLLKRCWHVPYTHVPYTMSTNMVLKWQNELDTRRIVRRKNDKIKDPKKAQNRR